MVVTDRPIIFQEFSFPGDPIIYITPSFSDLESLTFAVAKQVRCFATKFDLIVTLAKGGWAMTRSLVDFTQIDEIASIGVKFYVGVGRKLKKPEIYQDLPIDVRDKNILIFDDVADSGGSLLFVQKLLSDRGASIVKTSTLFYKLKSVVRPDFFSNISDAWIIFPFERVETGKLLASQWIKQGVTQRDIKQRCEALGLIYE